MKCKDVDFDRGRDGTPNHGWDAAFYTRPWWKLGVNIWGDGQITQLLGKMTLSPIFFAKMTLSPIFFVRTM